MNELRMILLCVWSGILMALVCILVGAGIMFKGKTAVPGERFIGGVPKGEVYSIPDALDAPDEPGEEEKGILAKTERFLSVLGGKG